MLGEPLNWVGHAKVMSRTVLGKDTACTVERVTGVDGIFVVKRWYKGVLASKSGNLTYGQACREVEFLQTVNS